MQIAYFDESGIDGAHDIVLIAGFIARIEEWPEINRLWKAQLEADRIPKFHYIDCKNQTGPYKGWDWYKDCVPHLTRLADILVESSVSGIVATCLGDWKNSVKGRPDLQERFPSAYSLCFDIMLQKIRTQMKAHKQSGVAMIFAEQKQYQRRALDVWHWRRKHESWSEISLIRYAKPSDVVALQMADMLAWETRRHFHKRGQQLRSLPLLSRLIQKQAETGIGLYEVAYSGDGLSDVRRATEEFLRRE